jgi:hypothetical protein
MTVTVTLNAVKILYWGEILRFAQDDTQVVTFVQHAATSHHFISLLLGQQVEL